MATTTKGVHVRKRRPLKLSDGTRVDVPDEFVSIIPIVFEVVCAARECHDAWTPKTAPVRLEAASRGDVERELRRRGWRPVYGKVSWHCPTHARA